jgi:hypothetical protein
MPEAAKDGDGQVFGKREPVYLELDGEPNAVLPVRDDQVQGIDHWG